MILQRFTLCGATIILASMFLIMIDQGIEGFPHGRPGVGRKSEHVSKGVGNRKNRPVPSCANMTLCEDIPYYPSDYVDFLLSTNDSLKYLATVDVVSAVSHRLDENDELEEKPLCASKEDVVQPKTGLNIDGHWLYILNSDSYVQTIRIETCTSPDTACSIIDQFAQGYKTTCRQTYIYRQMVAIGTDGKVTQELFKIPASCKCHYQFVADPWTRMRMDLDTGAKSQDRRKEGNIEDNIIFMGKDS